MAKPTRSQHRPVRSVGTRIPEVNALQWPQPPFYEIVDDSEAPRAEPAIALLRDGRKITGALTRFDPTEGVFEMRPDGGELTEIAPRDLIDLRLTRDRKSVV